MTIVFDPLTAYPAAELVHLTVALPLEIVGQIDDALAALPSVETRERFVGTRDSIRPSRHRPRCGGGSRLSLIDTSPEFAVRWSEHETDMRQPGAAAKRQPGERTMNLNAITDGQRRRNETTDDIIQQVRDAVRDELADAPESFRREGLEAIEETVLAHTHLVVAALGFEELQSEGSLLSHIANARVETNSLIRERRPG